MLFKRKDSPIWWISFTVRGRRTRCSSGTTDKAKALELHDKWKSEAWRKISLNEKPKFEWKDAALRWLEVKAEKATLHDDEAHLLFIQNFWKGKKLAEIGKEEIDRLKAKKKATGVSNATVNRMLSLVRAILRMSYKSGWIESVPPVELMPEPQKRIRWLTQTSKRKNNEKRMQILISAFFNDAEFDYSPLRGSGSRPRVPRLSFERACFRSA